MSKQLAAKCRQSSSLIILSKDKLLPSKSFDYKALLFARHEKASFMPRSSVFPGGVCEAADESPLWMKHFRSFGLQDEKLNELTQTSGPRPSIFAKHSEGCLKKEISLRITAIRETFEEVGIMICRARNELADSSGYGRFRDDFDRSHWQRVVHNDPAQFLTLCQELNVVPDLWSIHEWSAWLTPSTFKKRFETAFYLIALQEVPELVLEKNEVDSFAWKTPMDYITAYLNKELWLPPPQFYELSRMLNFTELEKLKEFARQRAKKGTTLMLPVQHKCTDGTVSVLPGDDMYPTDPNASNEPIPTHVTMETFRSGAKNLHRSEYVNLNDAVLQLNFPLADGQLNPVNVNLHGTV